MKLKYICLIPVIGFIVYTVMTVCCINKLSSSLGDSIWNIKWFGAFLFIHLFLILF